MRFPISYDDAKMRHPREVAAAVRALRASSSIQKATAPAKVEWFYTIAVRLDSRPPLLRRKNEGYDKMPLEERIQDRLLRSKAFLHAAVGRWSHHDGLSSLPPEWEKYVREELGKLQEQQDAFEAVFDTLKPK